MEFSIKTVAPEKQRCACLLVGVFENKGLSAAAGAVDAAADGAITRLLKSGDMEGKVGETLVVHQPPGIQATRVILVGCGNAKGLAPREYAKALEAAFAAAAKTAAGDVVSTLAEVAVTGCDFAWKARETAVQAGAAGYCFDETKSKKPARKNELKKVVVAAAAGDDTTAGTAALAEGAAVADGVELARHLGDLPANICTPSHLANEARKLARKHQALTVEVLTEKEMEALGMGALLSVAHGSQEPARFIVMDYRGGPQRRKPAVLVGKGVTFDTGGISIKPAQAMDEMKYDMCGAASVFGVMKALVTLDAPVNVVGLVPATENLPSGTATKPGDVVTSMSGQTIEVLNTDAEGRLILCDALTYAERYKPAVVVDIATLTGACIIALGAQASGLLGNNQPLVDRLLEAGTRANDPAWQLPLWEEYKEALKSNFADMANIGGREAGTITAAGFLSNFTEKYHWAHLDIAGTAWKTGKAKGATGRPVALLVEFLLHHQDA
ncbi:MAG: leucyl aminopeptidase [Gammaproteobacteria bacterium]|nr:leucyl aminopeptidase [Gammaproteobacteria bacterium]